MYQNTFKNLKENCTKCQSVEGKKSYVWCSNSTICGLHIVIILPVVYKMNISTSLFHRIIVNTLSGLAFLLQCYSLGLKLHKNKYHLVSSRLQVFKLYSEVQFHRCCTGSHHTVAVLMCPHLWVLPAIFYATGDARRSLHERPLEVQAM